LHISPEGNNPTIEIVELKKAGGADSPMMALVESICYVCQLARCWKFLKSETKEQKEFSQFDVRVLLAAPQRYWKSVSPKNRPLESAQVKQMRAIVAEVYKHLDPKPKSLSLVIADVEKTTGNLCELKEREDMKDVEVPEFKGATILSC
jgi:hypothetical protein